MPTLHCRHLTVEYDVKRSNEPLTALSDLSFDVENERFLSVVGPSGCGKTTLLKVLAGLQPASRGETSLNGNRITRPGHDRAMVFQDASLLPWRTVARNVTYGMELQGCRPDQARLRAQPYIDLVGLTGFEEYYPHELSGGMQQRANLARALSIEPDVLLMDEPLASLDPQMRETMQSELERIWLQDRKTAIFVTHSISEAVFLGDAVLVLSPRPGRLRAILPVNLPRPRPPQIRRHPDFLALEDRVWSLMQGQPEINDRPFAEQPQ